MDKDHGDANIQDAFLARARKERATVAVVLTGGKRLTGRIRSFDRYALILEDRGGEQMIFKHAIATIAVARAFNNTIRFSRPERPASDRPGPDRPATGAGPAPGSADRGAKGDAGAGDDTAPRDDPSS